MKKTKIRFKHNEQLHLPRVYCVREDFDTDEEYEEYLNQRQEVLSVSPEKDYEVEILASCERGYCNIDFGNDIFVYSVPKDSFEILP